MTNTLNKMYALKKYFGFSMFRVGQESLIDEIISGRDVLGIMPTSGGKSLCYQLPALLLGGVTIVISPLISLMKDQVDGLLENDIPSTFINSSLTASELSFRLDQLRHGAYKLCYVAPERLNTWEFQEITHDVDIGLIAIDEAHCISQWGHDFRPSYKEIPTFIANLPKRPPVAAFTATATQFVKDEIKSLLALQAPHEIVTGFDRPNLFYKVAKPQNKSKFVVNYLESMKTIQSKTSGIIFCATRKTVDSLTNELKKKGYSVEGYHAGYESDERKQIQENFMFDRTKIIVATNAFGMGIDKPDVRFVIHYNMPKNMEAYYQEAGRAGRDGEDSECILLYSPADIVKQKLMISSNSEMGAEEREDMMHANLQILVNYCHTHECLRTEILKYFGEHEERENCGNCGNCLNDSSLVDMTVEAQKILSCIYRTNQRYGSGTIIKVLRGSKDQKIMDWKLDQQSTYGIMKEQSEGLIKEIIMHLIAQGEINMAGGTYPILELSATSRQLLKGETKFFLKQDRLDASTLSKKERPNRVKTTKSKKSSGSKKTPEKAVSSESTEALYENLVNLRKRLSTEKNLPAYIVFANATLIEMAEIMPQTKEEMMDIKGIGEKKFETYGDVFLEEIKKFCEESL